MPQSPKIWKISRNSNFTSNVSTHAIITFQGVFVAAPEFTDYFSWLIQHIVPTIKSDSQVFIYAEQETFCVNTLRLVCPKIFHKKTGPCFEALIIQSSFDCASRDWWIFLWFEYLVLNLLLISVINFRLKVLTNIYLI